MKFTIDKKVFSGALKYISSIINPIITNPLLTNILIKCENGKIILTSTNSIVSLKYEISDKFVIHSEGSILVKGKIIYNIVSKIIENELTIETIDLSIIRISTNSYSCDVNLSDSSSFPIIDFNIRNWENFSLPSKLIKEVVDKIAPLASTSSNGMTILHGILFDSTKEDGKIEIIASDSYKLGRLLNEYMGPQIKFVIRTDNLRQIYEKLDNDENVVFYKNNNNLIINIKEIWLSCSLFDGEFPSASKIINQPREHEFLINKNILLNALERGLTFVSAESKPSVLIDVKENNIALNFRSVEFGSSYEEIPIKNKTKISLSYILNVRYLTDLIKLFSSNEILFEIEGPNKAIILKDQNDKNYSSLILPIKS